jgi:ClpP class serine protease
MVRRLVEGASAEFQKAVRAGRNLSAAAVTALWTGDVWMASDAKSKGLVDRVESWGASVERLAAPLRAKAAKRRLAR